MGYGVATLNYDKRLKNLQKDYINDCFDVVYHDDVVQFRGVDILTYPMYVVFEGQRYYVYHFEKDITNKSRIMYDMIKIPSIGNDDFVIINGDRIYLTQEQLDKVYERK